ncbi:MAG: NADH-quinone oxidoreductase subunit L [Flavobacteriales bacterium]|nr:NADH-quinone oxidoreductase subunit L [Flavobacteriales bacterium]MCC6939153.1 NADH-quinone oxidoreductase subunit L [Flavobacteriales bacterium]
MTDLLAVLVPALPLAGAVLLSALRRKLSATVAGSIATALIAISFVATVILFSGFDTEAGGRTVRILDWLNITGMDIPLALRIDALSLTMMLIVTGVGALIHLYSIGYMHDDERAPTFFAQLNLFSFAMLMLVMGSNFLVTFIGWEGVGLCSYLLIGFWYTKPDYNYAARKAFVMNRIGDVGMVLAMALLFHFLGTLEYAAVMEQAHSIPAWGLLAITLLLFFGATGKSAQIPLFTWLPDAMAGPTPVSALIHAATMVTAGVFLVVRSSVLFDLVPYTRDVILWTGTATALLAATIGLFQNDIKKVLAYSTVSQLGYMFAALGMGAYSAAMFHVTTHAFFKALLFLAAGSVIHALGGEQDIRKMGGLKGSIKITFVTFFIGTIAISGLPLMSGFFSKDLILAHAFQHSPVAFGLLVFGAVLTTFYMFRLLFLVFYGTYRGKAHAHESPLTMTVPLMVLAVLSVVGGALNLPHLFGGHEPMKHFLESAAAAIRSEEIELSASTEWILMGITAVLVFTTIAFAYGRFVKRTTLEGDEADMPLLKRLIAQRWRVDELYAALFEKPYGWLSEHFHSIGELRIMVPLQNGVGEAALRVGNVVRKLQTGNASFHLLAMVAGIILFLVITLLSN